MGSPMDCSRNIPRGSRLSGALGKPWIWMSRTSPPPGGGAREACLAALNCQITAYLKLALGGLVPYASRVPPVMTGLVGVPCCYTVRVLHTKEVEGLGMCQVDPCPNSPKTWWVWL